MLLNLPQPGKQATDNALILSQLFVLLEKLNLLKHKMIVTQLLIPWVSSVE